MGFFRSVREKYFTNLKVRMKEDILSAKLISKPKDHKTGNINISSKNIIT